MPLKSTPRKGPITEPSDTLPTHSYELIRLLDKQVPAEGIKRGESVEDAHRRAGAREVVQQLLDWMNDELEEINSRTA